MKKHLPTIFISLFAIVINFVLLPLATNTATINAAPARCFERRSDIYIEVICDQLVEQADEEATLTEDGRYFLSISQGASSSLVLSLPSCPTQDQVFTTQPVAYNLATNCISESTREAVAEYASSGTSPVSTSSGQGEIDEMLITIINVLTAVAGIAITASMILAGFQYMTARDNAAQVLAAKTRIFVTVCTIFLLAFGYSLLQWLVPGGIFN